MFTVDQQSPAVLQHGGVQTLQLQDKHQVQQHNYLRTKTTGKCPDHVQGGEAGREHQPSPQDRPAGEKHRLAEGAARPDGGGAPL